MYVKTYRGFSEVEHVAKKAKSRWLFILVTGIVLLVAGVLAAVPLFTGLPALPDLQGFAPRSDMPGVVVVDVSGRSGSGFFVATDLVLTSAYVAQTVGESATIRNSEGSELTGQVVATGFAEWSAAAGSSGAAEDDYAVVKVASQLQIAPLMYGTVASVSPKASLAVASLESDQVVLQQFTARRLDGSLIILDELPDYQLIGGPVLQLERGEDASSALVVGMVASPENNSGDGGAAVGIDVVREKCRAKGVSF